MSSWITNGLKTLRIRVSGGVVGPVSQQRSPQQYGASVKEVEIPQRPKRPLTPYFRFLGQVRDEVQKQNPSVHAKEIMRMIGQRWGNLDESIKQSYKEAYQSDLASYSSILERYNKSLTPQQKEAQHQLKLEKQLEKERRDKRRRLKELGRPKKPASAFLMYLAENIPRGTKMADYQIGAKKLGAAWKSMSEADKAPYTTKYEKESLNYSKALASWEDKMLRQGNDDVVREIRKNASTRSGKNKN